MDSLEVLALVAEKSRARARAISDEHAHLLYVHQHDMIDYVYQLKQTFKPEKHKGVYDVVLIGLAASDGTGDFLLHKKILKILRRFARTLTYSLSFADAKSGPRERNDRFRLQNMMLYDRFKKQNELHIDEFAEIPLEGGGEKENLNNILQYKFIQNLVNGKDAPYVIITSAFFYDDMMLTYDLNRAYYKPEARFLYLGECGSNTYRSHPSMLPGVSLGFSKSSIGMYYLSPDETRYDLRMVDDLFKRQTIFIFNHLKVSDKMYNDIKMEHAESKIIDDKFDSEFNPSDILFNLIILEIFIFISMDIDRGTVISALPDEFVFIMDDFLDTNEYLKMNFSITDQISNGLTTFLLTSNSNPKRVYTLMNLYGRVEKDDFNYLMYHSHYFAGVTGHNTFLHALSVHKIPLYDCLSHSVPCFEGFSSLVYRYVKRELHVKKIADVYEEYTNLFYVLDRYICTNGRAPTLFDYVTPFNLHAIKCVELFNHIFTHGILIDKYNMDYSLPCIVWGGSDAARVLRPGGGAPPPATPSRGYANQ